MRHPIRRSLACAAALTGILAAPGIAAGAPALDGININAHWLPEWNATIDHASELRMAGEARAAWVRMSISWNALEAGGARAYERAGSDEARALDHVERTVDGARAQGMRVLLFVDSTPAWANGHGAYAADLPPAESHYADYAAFLERMADRFQGRVGAWQIWNEPNLPRFWRSTDPFAYGRLVATASPRVRAADPSALVVSAGLSPDGTDPYEFLDGAMRAGMAGAIDRLGLHAYPDSTPEQCRRGSDGRPAPKDLCAVDRLVDEARGHQPGVSGWVTEVGWSNYERPGWGNYSSEPDQAAYLARANASMSASDRVDRAFWYGLHDLGTDRLSWDDNLGLTRSDYSPKPSFAAFAAANGGAPAAAVAPTPAAAPAPDPAPANVAAPSAAVSTSAAGARHAITCFGREPTLIGTPDADVIRGTNGPDVIVTLGGDDIVRGLRGDDHICLGSGDDRVIAGRGRDRVAAGAGNDRVAGGPGRDRIRAGAGNDRVTGGRGEDRVLAGAGRDWVSGGAGDDRMSGGRGPDVIFGRRGRDRLLGGPGRDRLLGASGRDLARGGGGLDRCRAEVMRSCRPVGPPRG